MAVFFLNLWPVWNDDTADGAKKDFRVENV
jgi:hypothetical protein